MVTLTEPVPILAVSTAIRLIDPADMLTHTARAELFGVCRGTLTRWQRRGHLNPYQADRIACQLGKHPIQIWPEWSEWVPD